jgi:hypothetical protein
LTSESAPAARPSLLSLQTQHPRAIVNRSHADYAAALHRMQSPVVSVTPAR